MALERHLGTRLFNRSKRSSVSLTSAGELFLPEATAILRQCERAQTIGRRAGRGELGRIEIGFVASAALSGTVSRAVRKFRSRAPAVELILQDMETPRQIIEIMGGGLDVGFMRARDYYPPELEVIPIVRDRLLIAMPADHPLAKRKKLQARELAEIEFILPYFDEESGFFRQLQDIGHAGRFSPKLSASVRDFVTVMTSVSAGLGFGLVPASISNLAVPGTVLRPVDDVDLASSLVFALRRAEASPVIAMFHKSVISK
jgi:DNA-binding transcriptional LysR family regulator